MSITKGAMLISNANAVGTELVNQLGGTGYKPVEWSDKINLLGINSVDAPYAIKSIQAGTYTGEERGAIQYSNCNAVGSMLNKKLNTNRGFKPVEWPSAIKVLKALTENTVSGDICNVSDGADRVPLKSWSVNIPVNLSGKSTVVCTDAGKNLFNVADYSKIYTDRDGVDTYNYRYMIIQLKPNTTYTVSQNSGAYAGTPIVLINNTLPVGGANYFDLRKASDTKTYTTDNTGCLYIGSVNSYDDVVYERLQECNVQIEVGSTATTYTQYVAPTVNTVDLGRTVYGADVDVVGGSGSETYGKYSITGQETGDFLAGTNNNGYRIGIKISGAQTPLYTGGISNIGENKPCLASSTWTIGSWCIYTDNKLYFVVPNEYTTFAMALQYLVDNNATFVFPLATPTDFTFDPITPTPETNTSVNFWNDTGSNTITYYQAPTALTRSTVSGSIASFSDADTRLTCVNAIATIPPSIAGVDTVQLVDAGKNLLSMVNYDGGVYNPDVDRQLNLTVSETQFTKTGNVYSVTTSATWKTFTVLFPLISGVTYYEKWTLSIESGQQGSTRAYLDENFKVLARYNNNSSDPITTNGVMTPPTGSKYLAITWTNRSTAIQTLNITEPMIELGTSASAWEEYNATTYTANLPSTNYGGSVDFVNGDETKTHATVDMGSLTWTYHPASGSLSAYFDTYLPNDAKVGNNQEAFDGVSENYISIPSSQIALSGHDNMVMALGNGTRRFFLCDQRYTNAEDLKNALNGQILAYPLTTPTTASITGQAIIPKTGTNNCYNNVGGNTEITYFTNT